jgi:hypothetical protein
VASPSSNHPGQTDEANRPAQPDPDELFRSHGPSGDEKRSWLPWIIAGAAVVVVLGALIALTRHQPTQDLGGAALAPADPYAANLSVSGLQMSEAGNFVGGKVTYLDGKIANKGSQTLTGITVQVGFQAFTGELAQKETLPMSLIRAREPYIDTEPVSAAPIRPGEEREFRLIFDHVNPEWNQAYPEVRIIHVQTK